MNCPLCRSDTVVLKKDQADRRRKCTQCGNRFTTTEVLKDEHERRERIIEDAKALAERLSEAA